MWIGIAVLLVVVLAVGGVFLIGTAYEQNRHP